MHYCVLGLIFRKQDFIQAITVAKNLSYPYFQVLVPPCAEDGGADAERGGAVFDGDGVVVAHSH